MGRGPCARMQAGWCPYGGRTCVESHRRCAMWQSAKKRTAALVRWARARKGEGSIGRKPKNATKGGR